MQQLASFSLANVDSIHLCANSHGRVPRLSQTQPMRMCNPKPKLILHWTSWVVIHWAHRASFRNSAVFSNILGFSNMQVPGMGFTWCPKWAWYPTIIHKVWIHDRGHMWITMIYVSCLSYKCPPTISQT